MLCAHVDVITSKKTNTLPLLNACTLMSVCTFKKNCSFSCFVCVRVCVCVVFCFLFFLPRYFKQLLNNKQTVEKEMGQHSDDITAVNMMLGELFKTSLGIHLLRITNSTAVDGIVYDVPTENTTKTGEDAAHVSKTRKRRIPAPENSVIFNLNCDPEAASKQFLAEVHKSNKTQEAFRECQPFNGHIPKTWLHYIARLVWLDVVISPLFDFEREKKSLIAQREDLDLKANALRKWAV